MHTPNVYLDAAHQRLRHATSDEVNADASPQHSSAPTRSHDVWPFLSQGLSSLRNEPYFTAQHPLSPPSDTYGLTDGVNPDGDYPSETWQANSALLRTTFQKPPHHLPTPPTYDIQQPLQACANHLEWIGPDINQSYGEQHYFSQRRPVPNGLPSSHGDFLPQTHAYLACKAACNTRNAPIWNVDGTGGNREDRIYDKCPRSGSFYPAHLSEYSARYGTPSIQPQFYRVASMPAALQPNRASLVASSPILTGHHFYPNQLPVLQEWRTDNLTSELCHETSHLARHSHSPGAEPLKTSRKFPDAATRRKQEKYRQKGEARRNTIAAAASQTLAHRPVPPSEPRPLHAPPAKRRKVTEVAADQICRSSLPKPPVNTYQSPYDDQGHTGAALNNFYSDTAVSKLSIIKLPPPTADELPQAIVGEHEDYKWSVFRYQLQPKGYDFAQRWVQELFDTTLSAEYNARHVTHVSQGFIKDGDRYSIIVLHNAANPFEYEPSPTSTVTIGVYGYYWHQHNEIHWTTLASDQRHLFVQCIQGGWLVEKYKWTYDAKPSERRFHRAYWMAANRLDMRGLLNRGPSNDKPHDGLEELCEDTDQDFSISEDDLTNEWEVTDIMAVAAWQKVQDEIAGLGEDFELCGAGFQHVVIDNSEW